MRLVNAICRFVELAPALTRSVSSASIGEARAAHRRSRCARPPGDVTHWVEGFNSGDHPNRLAHNLAEAEALGDSAWLERMRTMIEIGYDGFERLMRVLNDPAYRDGCSHGYLDIRTQSKDTPRWKRKQAPPR